MAAETLTITDGTTTLSAARMSTTVGIKLVHCIPDGELQAIKTYHLPGVNGNYVSRGGTTGADITIRLRFQGPGDGGVNDPFIIYEATNTFVSNADDIDKTPLSITYRGKTYTRCEAVSVKRVTNPKPTVRTAGHVWFDADYIFTTND